MKLVRIEELMQMEKFNLKKENSESKFIRNKKNVFNHRFFRKDGKWIKS